MPYQLKQTEEFISQFGALPNVVQEAYEKRFKTLESNPYNIGKPLGYKFFRELKHGGYRVYYLVYDEKVIVLFVGVSSKKNQQEVIDNIKTNIKNFKDIVDSI